MKFKKGKKYKIIKTFNGSGKVFKEGSTITILAVNLSSCPVESSIFIKGHDCNGLGKDGHCWNIGMADMNSNADCLTFTSKVIKKEEIVQPIKRLNQSDFLKELNTIV